MKDRVLVLVLALALGGCNLLITYPAPVEESGALCQNRIDDDVDGRLDCDDAEFCASTPACAEVGPVACADGRDNDRDGLFDCADEGCGGCSESRADECFDGLDQDLDGRTDDDDPGCWPSRPPELTRCASLAPETGAAHFTETGATGIPLYATPEVYYEGYAGGLWFYPYGDDGTGAVASTGSVPLRDGLRYEVDLATEEYDAERVWIALVPERLAPVGARILPAAAAVEVAVEVDYNSGEIIARAGGMEHRAPYDRLGGLRLALSTESGVVTASVARPETPLSPEVVLPGLDLPTDLGAVRLVVGMVGGVTLLDMRFTAAGVDPCGHAVPELPGADDREFGEELGLLDVGLGMAAVQAGGSYCALAVSCERGGVETIRTVTAWASTDGLAWEERIPPIAPSAGTEIGGVALAWDEGARAYRAAIARRPPGGGPAEVLLVTGFSCGDWDTPTPSGLAGLALDGAPGCDGGSATSLSYVIEPERDIEGVRHEIWMAGALGPTGEHGMARALSSDGRSFRIERSPDGRDPVPGPVAVTGIGRDRVRVRPTAAGAVIPGLVLEVALDRDASAWSAVGSANPGLLPATGAPRTFDGDTPIAGIVVPGLPGLAEYIVLYAGRGDFVARRSSGVGYASVGTARLDTAPNEE